jgi:TusA-related sulfurtransferase
MWRSIVDSYRVIYQRHAVERMAQRGVSEEDVMQVLLTGETIQVYADDTPFPSELILGWLKRRPLHIVVATDTVHQRKIVITIYEPHPDQWEADFRRKKS